MSKPKFPPDVKREVRLKSGAVCAVCRGSPVEVHHIDTTLKTPQLNREDNAITLCDEHHKRFAPYTKGAENSATRGHLKFMKDMLYRDMEDPQYQKFIEDLEDFKRSKERLRWIDREDERILQGSQSFSEYRGKRRELYAKATAVAEYGEIVVCRHCGKLKKKWNELCEHCGVNLDDF